MSAKLRRLAGAAAIAVMVGVAVPDQAHAQMMGGGSQIEATPKGTIGLGIIGAEVGFAIPALAGLHDTWAFIVFPLVGAGAGAIAGYYAIDNQDRENAAVGMLAAGMALIIPTMVLTLAMTAYDPGDDDDDEDEVDEGDGELEEDAEPEPEAAEEPLAQRRMRERARAARAGGGLFRINEGSLQLGVPGLSIRATYDREAQWLSGGQNQAQVHVALFTGAF
ncbi:MAG: hypothetical protein AAGE52_39045 [Myxococcota bacterium]